MPAPLVMIHGAAGAGRSLAPLADLLKPHRDVETPDLVGHGGRPLPAKFEIPDCARDLVEQLDAKGIDRAFFFGYSLGGMIALYLARHYPQRCAGICLLATKFVFDAQTVTHWTHLVDPTRLTRPGSRSPGRLEPLHAPQDWRVLVELLRRSFLDLGTNNPLPEVELQAIDVPTLIISGTHDQLVPGAETVALGKLIRGSQVMMFRGIAHPLDAVPVDGVAEQMRTWMDKVEGG